MGRDAVRDAEIARKGRMAALVIAGTGVFWILATILGGAWRSTNACARSST